MAARQFFFHSIIHYMKTSEKHKHLRFWRIVFTAAAIVAAIAFRQYALDVILITFMVAAGFLPLLAIVYTIRYAMLLSEPDHIEYKLYFGFNYFFDFRETMMKLIIKESDRHNKSLTYKELDSYYSNELFFVLVGAVVTIIAEMIIVLEHLGHVYENENGIEIINIIMSIA